MHSSEPAGAGPSTGPGPVTAGAHAPAMGAAFLGEAKAGCAVRVRSFIVDRVSEPVSDRHRHRRRRPAGSVVLGPAQRPLDDRARPRRRRGHPARRAGRAPASDQTRAQNQHLSWNGKHEESARRKATRGSRQPRDEGQGKGEFSLAATHELHTEWRGPPRRRSPAG